MAKPEAKKGHIKYKYVFTDDYNPRYVNGAHGGVNTKGEFVINFFLERPALPKSETFQVDDDGKLQDRIASEPEDLQSSIVRFVETGVVLHLEQAKELHSWMTKHIDRIEKLKNESNAEKQGDR